MRIFQLLIILFLIQNCNNRSYHVQGTILEIRQSSKQFLIHHDEIPGFMMAMTMPFSVADSIDMQRFTIGDSVHFQLTIQDRQSISSKYKIMGKGNIPNLDDDWNNDEYTPLEIGEIINDATFLDLDGNAKKISASDGKFRFISYIFSRCPMPNMCPAVISKNQYLSKTFEKNPKIEFFLISFDHIHDTPSIMKSMYGKYSDTYPNMKFYSSHGQLSDIIMFSNQSNLSFWGVNENDIGHTLRSIIIDPERRLMSAYEGMDWNPKTAERDIHNLLKAYY